MKKITALFIALLMGLCLVGCGDLSGDPSGGENDDPQTQVTPEPPSDTGGEDDPPATQEHTVDDLVKNFWQSETMYEESVLFIAKTDEQGNVIEAPKAKLLFDATEIISVKWHFHIDNDGEKELTLGTDFTLDKNVLTAKGDIVTDFFSDGAKVFEGTVPYVTDKQLTGEQAFPGLAHSTSIPSTTEGLYLPFTESYQIVQMQVCVTYRHALGWDGPTPSYQGDVLSHVASKLANKEKVELFVWGDSVTTGANSSSVLNIPPMLETWPELVAENLGRYFGTEVNLTNRAVGGWTSHNGVAGGTGWVGGQQITQGGLEEMLEGELLAYSPDLALIHFGLNDATAGVSANTYGKNIIKMIDLLRERNENCDIILIASIFPNPLARDQSKNNPELIHMMEMLSVVAGRYDGVCVADVGTMHKSLLDAGKNYTEMSSNNVNHPNDFLARIYAMNLLSTLIDTGSGTGTPSTPAAPAGKNEVHESYLKNGYSALFADPYLQNGVNVIDPATRKVSGSIAPETSDGDPSWTFAQWGTKYDILQYSDRSYFKSGAALSYISGGKTVDGQFVPAKRIDLDSELGTVYMELNAEVEYDRPRADGEDWPHTLFSQDFDKNLVHVSELSDLVMSMEYTVTKCEDKMNGEADPLKHCAQLVWYITLQNRTPSSKGYGQYIWFGLNLWDNRNAGYISSEYAAQDLGKEDATKAFIYQPSSTAFLKDGCIPDVGVKGEVAFKALETARYAFDLAKSRGYLPDTTWEDIYIGSMNFGFENTGTYNSAAQIDTVGVYYKK